MSPTDLLVMLTYGLGAIVAVAGSVRDLRSQRLPDTHTGALAAVAVAGFGAAAVVDGRWPPVGSLAGGAVLYALPWFVAHAVSSDSIGFGDVKYAGGLGLYIGWIDPPLALGATLAAGVAFKGVLVVRGRTLDGGGMPFGPFLAAGAVLVIAIGIANGTRGG